MWIKLNYCYFFFCFTYFLNSHRVIIWKPDFPKIFQVFFPIAMYYSVPCSFHSLLIFDTEPGFVTIRGWSAYLVSLDLQVTLTLARAVVTRGVAFLPVPGFGNPMESGFLLVFPVPGLISASSRALYPPLCRCSVSSTL